MHVRISGQSIFIVARPEIVKNGLDPVVFQGLAASSDARIAYDFANLLVDHSMRNPPVPPGWWRGGNINQNAIYLECFMDELPHELGEDLVAFRRKFLSKSLKHLAVLDAVAERVGRSKPAPKGLHRGVAVFMSYGSYVAAASEISVDDNKIKLHRVVAATDPGYAVNPAQIERQVAGSFVYGLSALF